MTIVKVRKPFCLGSRRYFHIGTEIEGHVCSGHILGSPVLPQQVLTKHWLFTLIFLALFLVKEALSFRG
jgi:riboflavin synthase alpha subunit